MNSAGFIETMVPVAVGRGTGEPNGNTSTSHCCTAGVGSVQPNNAEVEVILVAVNAVGLGQFGAGAQVTLATQPEGVTLLSDVNTNVKQPLVALEVNDGGRVVP